ncbi:MAG: hypothetical protein WDW38_000742 [Sanguina aurantia]
MMVFARRRKGRRSNSDVKLHTGNGEVQAGGGQPPSQSLPLVRHASTADYLAAAPVEQTSVWDQARRPARPAKLLSQTTSKSSTADLELLIQNGNTAHRLTGTTPIPLLPRSGAASLRTPSATPATASSPHSSIPNPLAALFARNSVSDAFGSIVLLCASRFSSDPASATLPEAVVPPQDPPAPLPDPDPRIQGIIGTATAGPRNAAAAPTEGHSQLTPAPGRQLAGPSTLEHPPTRRAPPSAQEVLPTASDVPLEASRGEPAAVPLPGPSLRPLTHPAASAASAPDVVLAPHPDAPTAAALAAPHATLEPLPPDAPSPSHDASVPAPGSGRPQPAVAPSDATAPPPPGLDQSGCQHTPPPTNPATGLRPHTLGTAALEPGCLLEPPPPPLSLAAVLALPRWGLPPVSHPYTSTNSRSSSSHDGLRVNRCPSANALLMSRDGLPLSPTGLRALQVLAAVERHSVTSSAANVVHLSASLHPSSPRTSLDNPALEVLSKGVYEAMWRRPRQQQQHRSSLTLEGAAPPPVPRRPPHHQPSLPNLRHHGSPWGVGAGSSLPPQAASLPPSSSCEFQATLHGSSFRRGASDAGKAHNASSLSPRMSVFDACLDGALSEGPPPRHGSSGTPPASDSSAVSSFCSQRRPSWTHPRVQQSSMGAACGPAPPQECTEADVASHAHDGHWLPGGSMHRTSNGLSVLGGRSRMAQPGHRADEAQLGCITTQDSGSLLTPALLSVGRMQQQQQRAGHQLPDCCSSVPRLSASSCGGAPGSVQDRGEAPSPVRRSGLGPLADSQHTSPTPHARPTSCSSNRDAAPSHIAHPVTPSSSPVTVAAAAAAAGRGLISHDIHLDTDSGEAVFTGTAPAAAASSPPTHEGLNQSSFQAAIQQLQLSCAQQQQQQQQQQQPSSRLSSSFPQLDGAPELSAASPGGAWAITRPGGAEPAGQAAAFAGCRDRRSLDVRSAGSDSSGGGSPLLVSAASVLRATRVAQEASLVEMHKAVEALFMSDCEVYRQVHESIKNVNSLAKETQRLEFCKDASGATIINQYVVVKALGQGSFGKVKLCLNTLDGNMYAIKMINQALIIRQLQRPTVLRKADRRGAAGLMQARPDHHHHHSGTNTVAPTQGGPCAGGPPQDPAFALPGSSSGTHALTGDGVRARRSGGSLDVLNSVMREIAVMKKMDHPHVVKLYEVINPPCSPHLMLVMEYMERGPVLETRKQSGFERLSEDRAQVVFRQVLSGLDYLHYNSLVHGDLKPENLLLSGRGEVKLADFGSCRVVGHGSSLPDGKSLCTPAFQAPECVSRGDADPFASDMWALGVCLFCFVCGALPFQGTCGIDVLASIRTQPLQFPPGETAVSQSVQHLISRLLDKDPQTRAKMQETMAHPWVTRGELRPMQCLKQLLAPPGLIRVSMIEQSSAINQSSFVSMIRAKTKEQSVQHGEFLFREGEEAHCIYMIMSGVVQLIRSLDDSNYQLGPLHVVPVYGNGAPQPLTHDPAGQGVGACDGGEAQGVLDPVGDGRDVLGSIASEDSFDVDLDDSINLEDPGIEKLGAPLVDGKLHLDRRQLTHLRDRTKSAVLGAGSEYVSGVKGPGQVVGEISFDTGCNTVHRHGARADGPVVVIKLTEENFIKALLRLYEDDVGRPAPTAGGGAGTLGGVAAGGVARGGTDAVGQAAGPGR